MKSQNRSSIFRSGKGRVKRRDQRQTATHAHQVFAERPHRTARGQRLFLLVSLMMCVDWWSYFGVRGKGGATELTDSARQDQRQKWKMSISLHV